MRATFQTVIRGGVVRQSVLPRAMAGRRQTTYDPNLVEVKSKVSRARSVANVCPSGREFSNCKGLIQHVLWAGKKCERVREREREGVDNVGGWVGGWVGGGVSNSVRRHWGACMALPSCAPPSCARCMGLRASDGCSSVESLRVSSRCWAAS